ncbi:MAG: TolC family protein [Spirochaetia bacterium]|nr:TolC family protein [Spirochaetia bacterium]
MKPVWLLLFVSASLSAEPPAELSLGEIWSRVQSQGRSRAAGLDLQAQTIARERAERHVYPRVYVDSRVVESNDATQSFMAILAQRSATLVDFLPARLNNPGNTTLGKAALGVDLPLYEGGGKTAMAKAQKHLEETRKEDLAFTVREEFATTVSLYAALLIAQDSNRRLATLDVQLNDILGRYQLGYAGNPVGYSGLIGLRTLKNRIQSLRNTATMQHEAARNTIQALAGLGDSWAYANVPLNRLLNENTQSGALLASHRLRSLEATGRMKADMIDVETSRFLPKVGAFAEAVAAGGQRKSATAYNVGFYLKMNLLAPEDIGARSQAKLESEAMNERISAIRRREEAEVRTLGSRIDAANRNMTLLDESEKLMDEQVRAARELFRSGSIQLLQYVEILSRRADLIEQRAALSSELTRAHTDLYLLSSDRHGSPLSEDKNENGK